MDEQQQNPTPTPAPTPAAAPTPEEELAAAKAKCDDYLAGWQRATADYANLKRDAEKAQLEVSRYASAGTLAKLLPVFDSFKKAMAQAPTLSPEHPPEYLVLSGWVTGVNAVLSQLDASLKAIGVETIDGAGVAFDPTIHEAMMAEKKEGAVPGSVVRVLESGYKMHDRVLRPAKVVVAE